MELSLFQKKVFALIMLISCFNLFMGCSRYYRPVKINTPTVQTKETTIKRLTSVNKFFILRKGNVNYALYNIALDETKMTLTANTGEVPFEHQHYLGTVKKNYTFSKAKHQADVLTEVHL